MVRPIPVAAGTPREITEAGGPGFVPARLYIQAPGFSRNQCRMLANQAVAEARKIAPKVSGQGAQGLRAYYGEGYFGIQWSHEYMWNQETGTNPFTMHSLAGKTIPMWIDDPLGKEARANPKAPRRTTVNGRRQILIFRKVAKKGQRKRVAVRDATGRLVRWRTVPASYPGAPGRIQQRRAPGGQIYSGPPRYHSGVRWRHPGIHQREFMQHSLRQVAALVNLDDAQVYVSYRRRVVRR